MMIFCVMGGWIIYREVCCIGLELRVLAGERWGWGGGTEYKLSG